MTLSQPGEVAALATAVCWTVTALSFEAASKRVGSLSLNVIRLLFAGIMFTIWGLVMRGLPLPTDATAHNWTWLSASAFFGFIVGDFALFRAFVLIGPRLSALIMSAVPIWTALFGYFVLGETLGLLDAGAMTLIVGGIAWAVADRHPGERKHDPKTGAKKQGVLLALVGSFGQASGLVLSKYGMGEYDAFAATQIRVLAGIVGFLIVVTILGWWPRLIKAFSDGRAMKYTLLGATFGPFLGVALSLLSIQLSDNTGVAAAIMATTPIMLVPAVMLQGHRVGIGGFAGAMLAVFGVAALFLT